ncbi:hypothetical protein Pyn_29423 [Prunus yedoensis var. nudiflora]|uniref:Uncharacterized protein n=1 Tax=Prunus yedoensis var. nudiflora TaxID=2094558 RepID=A0A314UNE8_PRUYE|nr:hypothetical protein Pyn_29423 [Prunus yedoensis var. nudiflora]
MRLIRSWRNRVVRARVPPFTPSSLCTSSFHEFWEGRLFSWLPEPAKLFHTSAFQGCPFAREMTGEEGKSMRRRLLHLQGIAVIETIQGESSVPESTARADVSSLVMWLWPRDWRNPCPFSFFSPFCPWPVKRR